MPPPDLVISVMFWYIFFQIRCQIKRNYTYSQIYLLGFGQSSNNIDYSLEPHDKSYYQTHKFFL